MGQLSHSRLQLISMYVLLGHMDPLALLLSNFSTFNGIFLPKTHSSVIKADMIEARKRKRLGSGLDM
jgi:hypothetical protein